MPDVFISYKKEDQDRVAPIAQALARAGYEVWWDHRIPPGRSYREVIGAAMASAKCVMVVWSKLSVAGQWVLDEADAGKQRGVLLPVMIDEVEIPFGFRQLEAARLISWSGDTANTEWQGVLEGVAHFVGRAPGGPPKPFAVPSAAPAPARAQAAPSPSAPAGPAKGGGSGVLVGLLALLVLGGGGFAGWQLGLFGGGAGPATQPVQNQPAPVAPAPAGPLAPAPAGQTPAPTPSPSPTPAAGPPDAQPAAQEVILQVRLPRGELRRAASGGFIQFNAQGQPIRRYLPAGPVSRDGRQVIEDALSKHTMITDPRGRNIFILDRRKAYTPPPGGSVQMGPEAPPVAATPATATIVWFERGGALIKTSDGTWVEAAGDENALNGHAWAEVERTATQLVLRALNRDARARIKFDEGVIDLWFPDWNEWRQMWRIRTVDSDVLR